jgi:DNA-binding HxlR family transcriptional regulator
LRLLRDHGIIRKLPRQHKYQLTDQGRRLTSVVNVLLGASTQKLLAIAA